MVKFEHQRYADAMMPWGLGYGLFHPASDVHDKAKPGVCGYLDDSGIWQTILDLNDEGALKAANLNKAPFALLKPASAETWGPKYTNTVKENIVSAEAGITAGIPVEFSTVLKYSSQSDFAAVLLCSDEVKLLAYPHKAPFRKWAKDNAKAVLEMCSDVATHGFFIMAMTWPAQDVDINVWNNKDNSVTIGVKGSVPQAGVTAGGSLEYHRGSSSGGWHRPQVTGDERRVVFFGGVYFKFRSITRRFKEVSQPDWSGYLGDDDQGKFLVETGGEAYEVESSVV